PPRYGGPGVTGPPARHPRGDRLSLPPPPASLPTLARAHDLDRVARTERSVLPGRARHHRAVERHRDAPLLGVYGLLFQEGRERRCAQNLVLAVDTDVSVSHAKLYPPHAGAVGWAKA